MITEREARMIAMELARLMRKEIGAMMSARVAEATEEYLNVEQAGRMLGWSKRTIYNKIADIPHCKLGKSLRFPKSKLAAYITDRGMQTTNTL